MYRHGFGDCFLVRFFEQQKCAFSMVIDCGLKLNDQVPGITMANVVDDIAARVNKDPDDNRPELDVLVITHEHWDHVSGFHPDKKLFDGFKIEKIWMAWTENPDDKEATLIREYINKGITALGIANEKLKDSLAKKTALFTAMANGKESLAAHEAFNKTIDEVASFFGPLEVTKTPSGITLKDKYTISVNSLKAINHVKSFANKDSAIQYLYPGDLITEKALPGIRIFILGPPKSALLNKSNPSTGVAKEVYLGMKDNALSGFVNHLLQMTDHPEALSTSPFLQSNFINKSDAERHPYYKDYFAANEQYRSIDDDFLNLAGALAMQLDGDTNNTSLAFAVEFIESGKVLLFPADAQVGNWQSWHDLQWNINSGSVDQVIKTSSLLNRTVFYKAGHHASHNATLKELGLELMISEDLVVFVPEKEDQYNGIPYVPLVERLKVRSKGRTFFSADKNYPPTEVLASKPPQLSKKEWADFTQNCEVADLFIEYTIHL